MFTSSDSGSFNYNENRTVLDMTAQRATAEIEVARQRFGIPAQELTLRAREETKRSYVVGGVVVLGIIGMIISPVVAGSIAIAVGVLAGVSQLPAVVDKLKKNSSAPD